MDPEDPSAKLRKSGRVKIPLIYELRNHVQSTYEDLTELLKQDISEIDNIEYLKSFSKSLSE